MSDELPKTGRGLSRNNLRKTPPSGHSSPSKVGLGSTASRYFSNQTQRPNPKIDETGLLFSLERFNLSARYGSREKQLPSSGLAKFTSRNLSKDHLAKPEVTQKISYSKRSTRDTIETPFSDPCATPFERESVETLKKSNSSHQDETFLSLIFQKQNPASEELSYLRGLTETPILSKSLERDSKILPHTQEEVLTKNALPEDEDENSPATLKSLNCFFDAKVESSNAETFIFPLSISEEAQQETISNQDSIKASECSDPKGCFSFRNPAFKVPFTSQKSENFEVFPLHFQQNNETSTQLNLRYAECE